MNTAVSSHVSMPIGGRWLVRFWGGIALALVIGLSVFSQTPEAKAQHGEVGGRHVTIFFGDSRLVSHLPTGENLDTDKVPVSDAFVIQWYDRNCPDRSTDDNDVVDFDDCDSIHTSQNRKRGTYPILRNYEDIPNPNTLRMLTNDSVSVGGSAVDLTLKEYVDPDHLIRVNYVKVAATRTKTIGGTEKTIGAPLQYTDSGGTTHELTDFTFNADGNGNIIQLDTPRANGNKLSIGVNSRLDLNSKPPPGAFIVMVTRDGHPLAVSVTEVSVSSGGISGGVVTLTLDHEIVSTDTVTVSYQRRANEPRLRHPVERIGLQVPSFTDLSVAYSQTPISTPTNPPQTSTNPPTTSTNPPTPTGGPQTPAGPQTPPTGGTPSPPPAGGGEEREEICDVSSRSLRGFVECAADSIGDSQSFGDTLGLLEELRDGSTYPVVVLLTERGGVYFHSGNRDIEDRNWSGIVSCTGSGSVLELQEGTGCSVAGGGYAHKFSASRVPLTHDQDFVLLGGFNGTPEGTSFQTEGVVGVPSPRAGEVDTDDELREFVGEAERVLGEAFRDEIDPAQLRGILRTGPWREGDVRVYILDERGRVIFDGGDRSREQMDESAQYRDIIGGAGREVVQYREGRSLIRGYAVRVEESGGVYIVGSGYGVEDPGGSGGGCAVGGSGGGVSGLFAALALLLAVLLGRRSGEDRGR